MSYCNSVVDVCKSAWMCVSVSVCLPFEWPNEQQASKWERKKSAMNWLKIFFSGYLHKRHVVQMYFHPYDTNNPFRKLHNKWIFISDFAFLVRHLFPLAPSIPHAPASPSLVFVSSSFVRLQPDCATHTHSIPCKHARNWQKDLMWHTATTTITH